MARINFICESKIVYLNSDTFHSEKTNRDYYNVTLFDSESGSTFKCNTNESIFERLSGIDKLSEIDAKFEFDVDYTRLYLVGF